MTLLVLYAVQRYHQSQNENNSELYRHIPIIFIVCTEMTLKFIYLGNGIVDCDNYTKKETGRYAECFYSNTKKMRSRALFRIKKGCASRGNESQKTRQTGRACIIYTILLLLFSMKGAMID